MQLILLSRLPARPILLSALVAGLLVACGDDVVDPVADVPAALAIVVAPTATVVNGTLITPQPVVELRNAEGEALRLAGVTVEVSASAGTLGGTTSVLTDADGRATFADLILTGQEGPAELQFSCCDLPPARQAVSLSFGENPLAAASATNIEGRAGSEMMPGPSVRLNSWAVGDGVRIRFTLAGPGSIPQSEVIANAQGVAELPSIRFGDRPGTSILTATIDGTQHRVQFEVTSTISGLVTIHDQSYPYYGRAGDPFTLPGITVHDGGVPVPDVDVRFRILSDPNAPIVTQATDAEGRIAGMTLPLSPTPAQNVFEVFAVGYMPAPVTLYVAGLKNPPLQLVTNAPANVMPLEDEYGRTFLSVRLVDALGEPVMGSDLYLTPVGEAGTFGWWDMLGPAGSGIGWTDETGGVSIQWNVPPEPGTYRLQVTSLYVPEPVTFTAVRE